MNLDVFEPLDFEEFHTVTPPEAAAARSSALTGHLASLPTLAVELIGGPSATYRVTDERVEVLGARSGPTPSPGWTSRRGRSSLSSSGRPTRSSTPASRVPRPVASPRSSAGSRFCGACSMSGHSTTLRATSSPTETGDLDLARSFELDDDSAEMGRFIRQAGYLHVRGCSTRRRSRSCRPRPSACGRPLVPMTADRGGRTSEGEERCCRLNYTNEGSAVIGEVAEDGRLDGLVAPAARTFGRRLTGLTGTPW